MAARGMAGAKLAKRQQPASPSTSNPVSKLLPVPKERQTPKTATSLSPFSSGLLSVPFSHPISSNVFGIGSKHPFPNFWTHQGGLSETISVLPEKLSANLILERYFESVDPVYPMIHRQTFYADYEHFWSLTPAERASQDPALVALIFAMLAMGLQFVTSNSPGERQQTSEFYASASNQSLRLSSYLNKTSIRSMQAMILITYFLINDNHASDGWAYAGMIIRQAYAMGLHRDPDIVVPHATVFEKQVRRKLWQAVLLQDTFLTVLLSLPPSATHTDVNVDEFIDDSSSIATTDPTDAAYIRHSWKLANFVQGAICTPRSLDRPIASSRHHKDQLLVAFNDIYQAFSVTFSTQDCAALARLAVSNKRIVRQTLFLSSNYYHNVMLLHSSKSAEVPMDFRGVLTAAHEAMNAFFLLCEIFWDDARVWWVFNHRAFLEGLCVGGLLREISQQRQLEGRGDASEWGREMDILTNMSRADICKCLDPLPFFAWRWIGWRRFWTSSPRAPLTLSHASATYRHHASDGRRRAWLRHGQDSSVGFRRVSLRRSGPEKR